MEEGLYIRVKQALTWLKRNKSLLQKDIADSMGMANASFTRGIMRLKEKRDEDFVIKFHSVVSEYISLDYLLNGTGELVANKNKEVRPNQEAHLDNSSLVNAALSAKDETIASLHRELKTKDELILTLKNRIEDLESRIAKHNQKEINDYPFDMGVAER